MIEESEELFSSMSETRINKLQSILYQEWVKDVKKMNDSKTKLFGFLLQLLTEDGEDRIRNDAARWKQLKDCCDLLLLWKDIITTTAVFDSRSEVETRRSARVAYQRCIQLGVESMLSLSSVLMFSMRLKKLII